MYIAEMSGASQSGADGTFLQRLRGSGFDTCMGFAYVQGRIAGQPKPADGTNPADKTPSGKSTSDKPPADKNPTDNSATSGNSGEKQEKSNDGSAGNRMAHK